MTAERGFSLVEVFVALTLFGFVSIGLGSAVRQGLRVYKQMSQDQRDIDQVRGLWSMLTPEVRNAVSFPEKPFFMNDNELVFYTTWDPTFPGGGGVFEIRYSKIPAEDNRFRIWKTVRSLTAPALSTGSEEITQEPMRLQWEVCYPKTLEINAANPWVGVSNSVDPLPLSLRLTAVTGLQGNRYQKIIDIPAASALGLFSNAAR